MSYNPRIRINNQIRARDLRVVTFEGENLGVLSLEEALSKAKESELDLIEISPNAKPPVAKIMDYGKFQYDEKKKAQKAKAQSQVTETKNIQIKPGTGEHDLMLKAKKISSWFKEGHRVKVELFLRGRAKYMDKKFLESRLQRILDLITEEYRIADGPKKSPKGLMVTVEREKK